MELLSLVAVAVYCATCLFMAVRLLRLWTRTHQLPELVFGLAYLSGGMIGYPGIVAADALIQAGQLSAGSAANATGQIGVALASFFLLLAWRQVFHPKGAWSLVFLVGWTAFLLASLAIVLQSVLVSGTSSAEMMREPSHWLLPIAEGGCFAALGWSSFRYGRVLVRRAAIGLGDPVAANRMFLWALSNLSILLSTVYALTLSVLARAGFVGAYQPLIIVTLGMISALFMVLAFFPPRVYVERIRARSSAGAD